MCWTGKPEISAAAGSSMLFHLTLFLSRSTNVHQGAWGILSECHRIVWIVIFSNGCRTGGLNLRFLAVIYWRPWLKFQSQTSEIAMAHGDMWAMAQWSWTYHASPSWVCRRTLQCFWLPTCLESLYIGMSAVACCSFFGPYSIRRYIILCRDINIYIHTVYIHISLYKLKNIDTILYLAYLGIPLYHPQPSAEILSAFGAPWAAGRPQNLRAQFLWHRLRFQLQKLKAAGQLLAGEVRKITSNCNSVTTMRMRLVIWLLML